LAEGISAYIEGQELTAAKQLEQVLKKVEGSAKSLKKTTSSLLTGVKGLKNAVAALGITTVVKKSLEAVTEYQSSIYKLSSLMGEGAQDAKDFADSLQEVVGINAAEFLGYQSKFYQSASGMGIVSDKARIMSQNLSQLAYDMASFNHEQENVAKYANKLNEAYTGSIKSLRNMGFALGEADLREEALLEGIDVNIRTLNAASKSMLRYNAIIRQSKSLQGSYINTTMSLAGAQGVLSAQFKSLYQILGSLIYPLALNIMPYIIGFVKALTSMVTTIAKALKIDMPVIDTTTSVQNVGAIGDEAEEVGKQIKESFTLGIDELNVFSKTAAGVSGIGGTDITNLINPESYDFLAGYEGSNAQKFFEGIQEKVEKLTPLFEGFGNVVAGFITAIKEFADEKLYPWLVNIGDWAADHPDTLKNIGTWLARIALVVAAIKLTQLDKLVGLLVDLATNANDARDKMVALGTIILTVAGIVLILKGAYDLVVGVMDIIKGKGDFLDNVKLAITGLIEILTGVLAIALAGVIKNLATTGAVGEAAFLGIGVAAGLMLIDLIQNWDERSYQIQQAFGKLMLELSKGFLNFKNTLKSLTDNIAGKIVGNAIKVIAKGLYELANGPLLTVLGMLDLINKTDYAKNFREATYGGFEKLIDDIFNLEKKDTTHHGRSFAVEEENQYTKFWEAYLGASQYDYDQAKQQKMLDEQTETKEQISSIKEQVDNLKKDLGLETTEQLSQDQLDKLDTLNTSLTENNKTTQTSISSFETKTLDLLEKVKTACENIKINITNNYGGGYAGGGYPTTGEVFFARERGPELIGRIGNRTAVMNNEQIYDGMYRTVTAALRQSSLSQPIEVTSVLELDGETVYRNQKKVEASKGFSMGGGVFAHI